MLALVVEAAGIAYRIIFPNGAHTRRVLSRLVEHQQRQKVDTESIHDESNILLARLAIRTIIRVQQRV